MQYYTQEDLMGPSERTLNIIRSLAYNYRYLANTRRQTQHRLLN